MLIDARGGRAPGGDDGPGGVGEDRRKGSSDPRRQRGIFPQRFGVCGAERHVCRDPAGGQGLEGKDRQGLYVRNECGVSPTASFGDEAPCGVRNRKEPKKASSSSSGPRSWAGGETGQDPHEGVLRNHEGLPAVPAHHVFPEHGVHLTTMDPEIAPLLKDMETMGVRIYSCGTV